MMTIEHARDLVANAHGAPGASDLALFIDGALAENPEAQTIDVRVTVETHNDIITAIHIR